MANKKKPAKVGRPKKVEKKLPISDKEFVKDVMGCLVEMSNFMQTLSEENDRIIQELEEHKILIKIIAKEIFGGKKCHSQHS